MDEKTTALIEQYDKEKKRKLKTVLFIALIILGAALIITALLFRTQYPFHLTDKGQIQFHYSHVLLRDTTRFDAFNRESAHKITYYIVYRNASIYYEQETDFTTYAAHANKENVEPGITNHSVIQTKLERYTFLAPDGKAYCYAEKTSALKALFDAAYADGLIYLRFAGYLGGAACTVLGILFLTKHLKKKPSPDNKEEI